MKETPDQRSALDLVARLASYPTLRAGVEELLAVIESEGDDRLTADQAEERVGEQLRELGQATLQNWAATQQTRQEQYWDARPGVQRKEKKSLPGRRATGG